MNLECGIVGLPNVGKSTLFNALTSAENAAAENFPFCTIDPNVGIVDVPDSRLEMITKLVKPQKEVPTTVRFVDIAGLVKGASKGEGLGNQFLGNIKDCDAIAHVVRCFDDPNVIHVEGGVDPLRDVEVIEMELMLADMATIDKRLERLAKLVRTGDKAAKATADHLGKIKALLDEGKPAKSLQATPEEWALSYDLHLITVKKVMYVANVDEASLVDPESNPFYKKLKAHADTVDSPVVPICAKIEAELLGLEPEEKQSFLEDLGIREPGLNKAIRTAYEILGLQTYFTAGEKEVRAWTFKKGWTAPQCAGVIHGDFERGFICVDTFSFDDLVKCGSEAKVKLAGLIRTEGKNYLVKDGDILHFKFNV